MRWFIDTEFMDHGEAGIDLISIGLVSESGHELYMVSSEFDSSACSEWVKLNVLPHLATGGRFSRREIRDAIVSMIKETGERPEFWGYFADYDWVLFCGLFGGMLSMPKDWPHLCFDLCQEMWRLGLSKRNVPPQDPATAHNALADAKWTRDTWKLVTWVDEK